MASSNRMTVRVFVGTLFRSWNGSLRRYDGAVVVVISENRDVKEGCGVRREV